ncbi:M15 family metallopeptidase [Halobacillus kuroshimensis]|uniref:M15 family metallopeptidase n=2 Tax=Bacillaceae TaxID=186817 RepID=A0ABS3DQL8_9BACI|nr:M15 family metallopeptidase [Halobacillus kuroshimensis]MBN8233616.1 M15 family metallopeptidase [Halobacillus kuroshimensis]
MALIGAALTGCSNNPLSSDDHKAEEAPASSTAQQDEKEGTPASGEAPQNEDTVLSNGMIEVGDPESVEVVVNKQRKLPDGYAPPDLTVPDVPFSFEEDHPKKQLRQEAADALEELFEGADQAGLGLVAASGYRSYERQKEIYERNVEVYGKEETDTFSASPGTSEHQTGLAMDVTSAEMAFKLTQAFGDTPEGEWVADHAYEYGFVVRYQEGNNDITGYKYEPWHLRYVGKEAAAEVHEQQVTLEEFFGYEPVNETE